MKKKVIAQKNLPSRFPVLQTITLVILMNYCDLPEWLDGALITVLSLAWIAMIIAFAEQKEVNIFKSKEDEN